MSCTRCARHKKGQQQLLEWRQSSKMRLVTLLGLLCVLLCLQWTQGDSSNPFEQLATGALSMGNQLLNRLQDGQMVQPQMNFDTPLLAVHSNSQLGFGNAMRRKGQSDDDDSSSSEERRKRRRRRRSLSHSHAHHRGKRAPCFKMMTTEPSDDVEARKKRAQKRAAANNAARSRIVKQMKKKKKKLHSRRRRQAQDQQKLGPTVGDRIKGLWLAFVDNVVDMAQQMREKVKAAAAQTPSGGN